MRTQIIWWRIIGSFGWWLCGLLAAQAQAFTGVWEDSKALESWFGGKFYESITVDTTDGAHRVTSIDSCVAHTYAGKRVQFNAPDVYTQVLGKYTFENDRKKYRLLITGTSDGYICGTCGVALSGSLWEQTGNRWDVVFAETDFAVRGAESIAPQVAFAEIGDDNQIGVFVWQRVINDSLYHFYYADIFTPLRRQFVQITGGNLQNENRLPNICNAVSSNGELPYNYETAFEFAVVPQKEMYDLTTRRQGTQVISGQIVPLDREYHYRWARVNYVLIDSIDMKIYLPHRAKGIEKLRDIAARYGTTLDELRNDNPQLTGRPTLTLLPNEVIYIATNNRDTVSNVAPSIASIEQAVGKPDDNPIDDKIDVPVQLPDDAQIAQTRMTKDSIAAPQGRTHTVAVGETLFGISRKYQIQMSDLQAFNDLPADFTVKKGQILRLEDPHNTVKRPSLADVKTNKNTQIIDKTIPITAPPQPPTQTHTVQKGETLFSIAKKYSVTLGQLQQLNHLKTYTLFLGQKLAIP
jgi:LysM repeat protein